MAFLVKGNVLRPKATGDVASRSPSHQTQLLLTNKFLILHFTRERSTKLTKLWTTAHLQSSWPTVLIFLGIQAVEVSSTNPKGFPGWSCARLSSTSFWIWPRMLLYQKRCLPPPGIANKVVLSKVKRRWLGLLLRESDIILWEKWSWNSNIGADYKASRGQQPHHRKKLNLGIIIE